MLKYSNSALFVAHLEYDNASFAYLHSNYKKIGNAHFLVLLWVITTSDFVVISESKFFDPPSLVWGKRAWPFTHKRAGQKSLACFFLTHTGL